MARILRQQVLARSRNVLSNSGKGDVRPDPFSQKAKTLLPRFLNCSPHNLPIKDILTKVDHPGRLSKWCIELTGFDYQLWAEEGDKIASTRLISYWNYRKVLRKPKLNSPQNGHYMVMGHREPKEKDPGYSPMPRRDGSSQVDQILFLGDQQRHGIQSPNIRTGTGW